MRTRVAPTTTSLRGVVLRSGIFEPIHSCICTYGVRAVILAQQTVPEGTPLRPIGGIQSDTAVYRKSKGKRVVLMEETVRPTTI